MPQSQSEQPVATWMDSIPAEQKIGIVIPMYGYFADLPEQQLEWEALSVFLKSVKSRNLKSFLVFPAETKRLSKNVQNVLIGRQQGGGMEIVQMDPYSSYGDYVQEGISYLLEETDCQFIVIANPWIFLKEDSIDQMAQRLNTVNADLVCGVDLRKIVWDGKVGIPAEEFEVFNFNPPTELNNKEFNLDFWGMTRAIAQVLKIDGTFKTKYFQLPDLWGNAFRASYSIVQTQYLPFYSFDVDWKQIDSEEEFLEDQAKFIAKWGFNPGTLWE